MYMLLVMLIAPALFFQVRKWNKRQKLKAWQIALEACIWSFHSSMSKETWAMQACAEKYHMTTRALIRRGQEDGCWEEPKGGLLLEQTSHSWWKHIVLTEKNSSPPLFLWLAWRSPRFSSPLHSHTDGVGTSQPLLTSAGCWTELSTASSPWCYVRYLSQLRKLGLHWSL